MPVLIPYALHFKSGLHLGTRGITLEEAGVSIPSDTLFSALMDVHLRAGGNADAYIAPFREGKAPFVLTSAFPLVGGVRFYPLPVERTRIFSASAFDKHGKTLKRIQYFSEGLFKLALSGSKLDDYLPEKDREAHAKGVFLQGKALWLTSEEVADLPESWRVKSEHFDTLSGERAWTSGRVPRVTLHRISSASEIYHAGRVIFSQDCGLWFGVSWREPESYKGLFLQALTLLQDDGLGGERSSGYGAFKFAEMSTPVQIPNHQPGAAAYLLNRYSPTKTETGPALTGKESAYQLVSVGGWMRSFGSVSQRRKRLVLVAEGSLVHLTEEISGQIQDVAPDYSNKAGNPSHAIYRAGIALAAGWQPR